MDIEYLQDPLSFRHFYEVNGSSSLPSLITNYLGGSTVNRALSLMCGDGWQDRQFHEAGLFKSVIGVDEDDSLIETATAYSDRSAFNYVAGGDVALEMPVDLVFAGNRLSIARNPDRFVQRAHSSLKEGGLFVYAGYAGAAKGPRSEEREKIDRFVRGVHPALRHPEAIGDEYLRSLFSDLGAGNRVIDAIENRFADVEILDMGGLLPYAAWKATSGFLSYDRDDHVAIPLMLQLMEQQLLENRIVFSGFKFVVGRK